MCIRDRPKRKNYLLVIGIDKYAELPKLYNAVNDAKEIVQILLEKYQFEESQLIELYNESATKKNIYRKLRELNKQVTPADNLLIYFSGHGEYDEGYWTPVEAENGEDSDYIPNSVIRTKLGAIKSHHIFLTADSCFQVLYYYWSATELDVDFAWYYYFDKINHGVFRSNYYKTCLLYTSPSPRDATLPRMPSSA